MAKTDGTAQWVVHNLASPYIKADTGYLPLSGGTISGNLAVTGKLTASLDHLIGYSQGTRLTSANRPTSTNGVGALYSFVATSSMTEGKPPIDSHILHFNWDNTGGYDAQLAIGQSNTGRVWTRSQNAGTWGDWRALVTAPKASAVGDASTPVYVNSSGQVVACTSAGTAGSVTVTASTQAARTASGTSAGGYDTTSTSGSGSLTGTSYSYQTVAGIAAGTYTLQTLLQNLVAKSHTHTVAQTITKYNCNCDCGDNCIVSGRVKTPMGYVDIKDLEVGNYVIGIDFKIHRILGMKTSMVKNRKVVYFEETPNAVLTDDHLFLLANGDYGAYDVAGYYRESKYPCGDENVLGTYARVREKDIVDLSKENYVMKPNLSKLCVKEVPYETVTYTPIVEGCEWIILDGLVVACARYIGKCS